MQPEGELIQVPLAAGVCLHLHRISSYKTVRVDICLSERIRKKRHSRLALISRLLERGTRKLPDLQSLNRFIDELFGAHYYAEINRLGGFQLIHLCLEVIDDQLLEDRDGRVLAKGLEFLRGVLLEPGAQEGLMFSRDHIRQFLLPRMQRMIDLVHQAGVYAFFHSDGAIRPVLPEMIDSGIDILNPIQWRCKGMERRALKRDFGDRVVFHGGVDNQYTLAFGSIEEVRQEVRDNLRIFGSGGGYILAPCHNIQAIGPPENIVALYETGRDEGWTRLHPPSPDIARSGTRTSPITPL